ncbi:MAG: autotransporter-associated beta strand repeat-containing protein [Bacteroidaceae bacterium]|nr:autotransporter-associated beta strand repeat-containing protein [Bacteroidaceae bacterium]
MKTRLYLLMFLLATTCAVQAQRFMDRIDRGLVATVAMSGSGNFVSWRIFGEEYYDVTYNLYANGSKIASDLKVSNYVHAGGNATTQYQVAPVVRGVEGEKCAAVTRWAGISNLTNGVGDNPHTGYIDINCQSAIDRDGQTCTNQYEFNDCVAADVTGDGVVELICKRNYTGGVNDAANKTRFHRIEVLKLDGTRLWWIDLGPNMMAGPDEQWDAVGFDWDMDGKAEVLLRGADNMVIHTATGHDIKVGNMNYYAPRSQYTCEGNEYLLYLNGETGEPYAKWDSAKDTFTPMAYPLKRYEAGETQSLAVWGKDGDGGHRSTKHYFGAPYLDGQHPSIFLGRGCYTRHKFCAYDVDPATHELKQRWYWSNNQGWNSPWYGNGYHNFGIQDVDMDGRDEIVFGSMVIDDNGKGLSTTGLGHGDAQHCSDLDPYRWGMEFFACNEDEPAMNYRNATTSKIYYRMQSTGDDGRALAGNFTNRYPGSVGQSSQTGVLSLTADKVISGQGGYALNFRIYWDGDLCSEILDSPGTAKAAKIEKLDGGRIFNSEGHLNNDSKNNACLTGDILGDWREELLVANGTGMRLYTTSRPTTFRIPTLWHDHGYRQGMVWETIGYNQPPHTSYFLGEMEGITVAPPSLTNTGRERIADGGTIDASLNGKQVLAYQNGNFGVSIAQGAEPWVAVFNVPSWVQGTNPSEVSTTTAPTYTYYTCTATGGGFAGATRLVKQGEGELILPAVAMTHTGNTDVWQGTLTFDGSLPKSALWLNRHTTLNSKGTFRSIKADYNATIQPAGKGAIGTLTADTLKLGFGSRVVFDLKSDITADQVCANVLTLETKNWQYGPKYLMPVFEFNIGADAQPTNGKYLLGTVGKLTGSLANLVIEGLGTQKKAELSLEEDKLYLIIESVREAGAIVWNGNASNTWDFGASENFTLLADATANTEYFVTGDVVTFNDDATKTSISLTGELEPDSVIVDGTKNYTFGGNGALVGKATLVKRGTGKLTINTDNSYTGGTRISGGTVAVTSISNANQQLGNLGAVTTAANKFVIENGAELQTSGVITQGSPMNMVTAEGGVINNAGDFVVNKPISGTVVTKKGNGWMKLNVNNTVNRMVITAGTVQCVSCSTPAKTVEFQGGQLLENGGSSYAIDVPKGKSGVQTLVATATFSNKITGEGTLTINCPVVEGSGWYATRCQIADDFSQFQGTIKAVATSTKDGDPRWTLNTASGLAKGTLDIADNTTVQNTGKTFAIGKVEGDGKLGGYASFSNNGGSGANTWKLGNDDNWSWKGIITANSNFTKTGSGKVSLTGAHDYTGNTVVEEGELHISGNAVKLGTGTLTVKKGAIFSGVTSTGALGNSSYSFNTGSVLQVGASAVATSGKLDFGGKNVTIAKGAIVELGLNSDKTYTTIQNIGKLSMNGTISLHYGTAFEPAVGMEFTLFAEVTTFTGTPVLEDYVVDAEKGLYWDDSDLATKGILRITDQVPVGIRAVERGTQNSDNAPVFDLAGRRVADAFGSVSLRPGIYVVGGKKVRVQ